MQGAEQLFAIDLGPSGHVSAWILGNQPDVPEGQMRHLLAAVLGIDGKRRTICLAYCNRYPMPLSDICSEPPEGCEPIPEDDYNYLWTGWVEGACDQCDTHWLYHQVNAIVAHMPMPTYHP